MFSGRQVARHALSDAGCSQRGKEQKHELIALLSVCFKSELTSGMDQVRGQRSKGGPVHRFPTGQFVHPSLLFSLLFSLLSGVLHSEVQ